MDELEFCQWSIDVDFKTATDILGLSATRLADEFGLQPQTIRQMRLSSEAVSYRSPPEGWQRVVADLARKRLSELNDLLDLLEHTTRTQAE